MMVMASRVKKITLNVPADVLERAQEITGEGVTSTIVHALEELERQAKRSALRQLKGKVKLDLDLETTRR